MPLSARPLRPFVVGLTGGIGSGKSAAAEAFAALGAAIVDTDAIAHELTGPRGPAMPAIREAFGKAVLTADGALDRVAMRALAFTVPAARQRLEAILHPQIRGESERLIAAHANAPYVILEKTRRGDRDVSISMPDQAWKGHTPVLIDDIVSTGKTMVEATRQLRAAGSAPPVCIAIHAVFADAVNDELMLAGARGIVTCDTIPHATNQIGVADSIADAVRARLA